MPARAVVRTEDRPHITGLIPPDAWPRVPAPRDGRVAREIGLPQSFGREARHKDPGHPAFGHRRLHPAPLVDERLRVACPRRWPGNSGARRPPLWGDCLNVCLSYITIWIAQRLLPGSSPPV
jgi:hypothetical protein